MPRPARAQLTLESGHAAHVLLRQPGRCWLAALLAACALNAEKGLHICASVPCSMSPARQVYGAYKYPRAQMHQLRPGAAVAQAGPMTPQTLTSPADGATRRVGPFEMKPQVALRCATPCNCRQVWLG